MRGLSNFGLLLLLSLTAACDQETKEIHRPNVILICLDTVRADHLGSYGYAQQETTPFLDSMAECSQVFTNTSATACWTKPSVPSILTGLLPMQHGVYRGSAKDEAGAFTDVLPAQAHTLAEVFKENGYQTAAFIKNSQLRQGLGFEQGFDVYRDQAGDARQIRWRASDWLDARDPARPFFLYLHLLDAHWPYAVPDEYASMWSDPEQVRRIRSADWRAFRDAINGGERELSGDERNALIALYDGSIRYMDDQLALLWDKLKREGSAQSTIFCLLSDHGEEFMEHGRLGHGHGLYKNLLAVPWILRVPSLPAARIETPTSLIDVFPTLLAAAGINHFSETLPGINRLLGKHSIEAIIAEHLDPKSYHIALTWPGQKTIERITPLLDEDQTSVSIPELQLRGRWEAEIEGTEGERARITRMRPAKEADEGIAEIELKGSVSHLSAIGFSIQGIRVDTSYGPEFYGYTSPGGADASALSNGQMVKARGNIRSGQLIARKIKRYGPESERQSEIRGPIEVLDESTLSIGSVPLSFGEFTLVDFRGARNDLGIRDVVDILQGQRSWEEHSLVRFDLAKDPFEMNPMDSPQGPLSDPEFSARIRELLDAGVWMGAERKALDQEAQDDLRAIGY